MIERIEINLLPAEYRIHKRTLKLQRSMVYSALAVVVLLFSGVSVSIYMQSRVTSLEDEIAAIEQDILANKNTQAEINKLRTEKREIEQKIIALERINVNREKWVRLMEVFSGSLPVNSWLTAIKEETETRVVRIEARTYSFHEVASYMSKLEESEFINTVELTEIEQMEGAVQGRDVYRFSISCIVNPDAKLNVLRREDN